MKQFASGDRVLAEGNEDEFVQRWTHCLRWTKAEAPGLIEAHLLRDMQDPRHFHSFSEWTDEASRTSWRTHDDFRSPSRPLRVSVMRSRTPTTSSPPR